MTSRGASRLALAVIGALPAAAHAQSAASSSTQATAGQTDTSQQATTAGTVPDIIVTATKRAESIQNVPLSISAVTGAALQNQNVHDFSRLDVLVPGLKFGQSGNDARPAIRGTRTQNVVGNADPLVAFYNDGVYRSRPGQALATFVDVERVEVARGPQGTLFGRNSFGGAVNVISRAPKLDLVDFGGSAEVTNYSGLRVEGFVNVPLGTTAALRLSGYDARRDGWVRNSAGPDLHDERNQVIRGQLLFEPSADFSNVFRVEYWHGGGAGPGAYGYYVPGIPIDPATGNTNGVAGVIDRRIAPNANPNGGGYGGLLPGTLGDPDWRRISRNLEAYRRINQIAFSDEANLSLGDFANLRGIFSYTRYTEHRAADPDYSAQPVNTETDNIKTETASEELQLTSKGGARFNWVLGAYFLQDRPQDLYTFGTDLTGKRTDGIISSIDPRIDPGIFLYGPGGTPTDATAFYADGNYTIVDGFRVLGGIRWTQDRRRAFFENPNYDNNYATPPARGRKTFEKFTYRAGFQIDLAPRSMLYGTYSTGFLSGGFNNEPALSTFNPQLANAYEFGSKNVLFDGKVRANLAVFRNRYTNLLSQRLVQLPNGVIQTFTTNAGRVKSWGAEAEVDLYPSRDAYLGLRAAYNHSRFGDFIASNSFFEGGNLPNGSFQLNGLQVPLNPDWSLTGIASYDIDTGGRGIFTPSATVFYSSSYRTSDQPYFFSRQPSYATVDAFVRWKPSADSALSVEAFGNNLTNHRILLRTTPNSGAVIFQDFANPRIYGIRVAYRY